MRLLLADDSEVVRVVVSAKVRAALPGVDVVVAASFREAVGCIDAPGSFDAAVLDVDLGDGKGTDLARTLREKSPSTRIAFYTSEPEGPVAGGPSDFGPVFDKPAGLAALIDWLRSG